MLIDADRHHQTSFFGTDLLQQLDPSDALVLLADTIPWRHFEQAFSHHYSASKGRPSHPIRKLVGLLILKQLENLSDEEVVLQWKRNPYYQYFCGMTFFKISHLAIQRSWVKRNSLQIDYSAASDRAYANFIGLRPTGSS